MERDPSVGETYRNVLIYATAMVGGEQSLAERLGVSAQQILDWTTGIEPIPTAVFLKAVDVVTAATPEDIRRSRQAFTNGSSSASPK
jgi:DNA-binding transcriptional regulator YdaS (Cro superfamily)